MNKMGTIVLELQNRANEMGYETVDECIAAGYTPDLMTGTWATPENDLHKDYEEKAHALYDKMNTEFNTMKNAMGEPKDTDYYKLAMLYEIKEMVEQMDETDREILDKLDACEQPLHRAYDAWTRYDEVPSLWEQLRGAMKWKL